MDDTRVLYSHLSIIQLFEYDAAIWVHLVDLWGNGQKAIGLQGGPKWLHQELNDTQMAASYSSIIQPAG